MDRIEFLRGRLRDIARQCQQIADDDGYTERVRKLAKDMRDDLECVIESSLVPCEGAPF